MKQGTDIGQLLLDESSKGLGKVAKAPYFLLYANLFLAAANVICPAATSSSISEEISLS